MKKKITSLIIALSFVPVSGVLFFSTRIFEIKGSSEVSTEKIAAFFWANDVSCDQSIVNGYIDILEDEGYTKFFCFEDTENFTADFQQVADYEKSGDIIFFYLFGHGGNDGQHSVTVLNPGKVSVWSNEFRDLCDTLDSSRIGSLVESCHSGDWADDMMGGGYLAIGTSNETSLSYMTASGGIFTNKFFEAIDSGSNAIDAFLIAEVRVQEGIPQNPKLCDESMYDFFAN